MKHTFPALLLSTLPWAIALPAVAQKPPAPPAPMDQADGAPRPSAKPQTDRINSAAKATDLIGMAVRTYQNEALGKVSDLALDVESGRIVQVILAVGAIYKAVPPSSLWHDVAGGILRLDADPAKLAQAPSFDMAKWTSSYDPAHLSAVCRYYGQDGDFAFVSKGDGSADGMIPLSRLVHVQQASKLMGVPVKNLNGEALGKVDNFILDVASARIIAVIISSGSFLGVAGELSAVAPSALRFTTEWDTLKLDTSKEALGMAPHFSASQWPDFAQSEYAAGVYTAYKVDPYFGTAADNTKRNARDRDAAAVTPLGQGNNQADIAATAQIRRQIMASKGISINAQNIKIITNDGNITLRGPVATAEEKLLIAEIARTSAHTGTITNLLEVTK